MTARQLAKTQISAGYGFGTFWGNLEHFRQLWAIYGKYGILLAIMGLLGPFWTIL
jgi:hypothetical protein